MKLHILPVLLSMLALSAITMAQVPRLLSYQGVLTDSLDNPRPDGAYAFTFRLYTAAGGGSAIWTESKSLTTKHGLFSTMLGDQTALTSVPFDRAYWLSIQVAPDPEPPSRIQIGASGYSISSINADTAGIARTVADNSVTSAKIVDHSILFSDIAQNGAGTGSVMTWNGSAWTAGSGGPWQLNGTTAFYPGGNVGIGRNTAWASLSFQNAVGEKISLWGDSGAYYGFGVQSYRMQMFTDSYLSDLTFGYGSSANFTENMRIKGGGFVGIGTSAPSSKLTVYDTTNALRVATRDVGSRLASFGGAGTFEIDSTGRNGGRVMVKDNGNVGIGMINPQEKLHVIGNIRLNLTTIRSGTGDPNGVYVGTKGDLFLRIDGGAGTTLYVKEGLSGNNTGWVGK
jgi:hypothetical protein